MPSSSYRLQISEAQRAALLEVLSTHPELAKHTAADQPLEYWVDMLTDLEKCDDWQMLHGFCL